MNRFWQQGLALVFFLALCFGAAAIGGYFTGQSVGTWYLTLNKPSWNPPSWLFGPVWTFLYLCMAVAAWLVWRRAGFAGAKLPLSLFVIQLILNAVWSFLFFGLRNPVAAFFEILLLWVTILLTLIQFWRVNKVAGALFVPYLLWVSFASILNFTIWRLNLSA